MSDSTRTVTTTRFFEDFPVGLTFESRGSVSVDADEIVAFGRAYDPQPFHVDAEVAATGPFGGLIASGWQTAALMMRLYVDEYIAGAASLGGPGADELRWLAPVRPGAVLRLRAIVVEATPSRSKPDRGVIRTRVELVDERGVVAFSVVVMNLMARRPSVAASIGQARP